VTDPQYAELLDQVWLWSEWPDRWGKDAGIDLVARERATGDYWAIQCKFYLPDHYLPKDGIDLFLSESGRQFATNEGTKAFVNRLIVSTTDHWSSEAEKSLQNQVVPVERLRLLDLDNSPVDWASGVDRILHYRPQASSKSPLAVNKTGHDATPEEALRTAV